MNSLFSTGFPKTTARQPVTSSSAGLAGASRPSGYGFGSSGVSRRAIAAAMSDRDPKNDPSLCKVRLEITVHNLPSMPGGAKRSFLDFLYLDDQYDVVYLQEAIRAKLLSVDCEGVDFEILTPSGFVVDEAYFHDILQKALNRGKQPATQPAGGGIATLGGIGAPSSSSASAAALEPETWAFDVYIKQKKLTLDALSSLGGSGGGSGDPRQQHQQPMVITSNTLHALAANHSSNNSRGMAGMGAPPVVAAPATGHLATALNAVLSDRSAVQLVPIAALNASLPRGKWRLECRVKTVKKKSDTIAECELADLYVSHQTISLVTFRRDCLDRLLRLRPNSCVQLWNVQCGAKSARDQQFSTNSHPMKLIFDEGSEVTPIDDPIIVSSVEGGPLQAIGTRTFRPHPSAATGALPANPMPYTPNSGSSFMAPPPPPSAGGFPSAPPSLSGVSAGIIPTRPFNNNGGDVDAASTVGSLANTMRTGVTSLATTGTMRSNASSSAISATFGGAAPPTTVKRTLLFPKPLPPVAPAAAVAPPPLPQQATSSSSAGHSPTVAAEVSLADARDDYISLKTAEYEADAERMKKKLRRELTDKCFICEMDLEDDADIAKLYSRLQKFARKVPMPTPERVRELMADRRTQLPDFVEDRFYCTTTFVNTTTKRLHRVHCRCAHVCTEYQRGDDLRTIVAMAFANDCALCGEGGACMRCTNPECEEWYHTTCAIFSNGYVNFDIRDPYLPRPACPRHTNPNPSANRTIRLAWVPHSGGEAFDSAVVDRYDLRDPDDE